MHLHLGAVDYLKFVAYFVITMFGLRILVGLNRNNPIGEGLAFLC